MRLEGLRCLLPGLVLAATWLADPALAWGPEGHRIVARIAEQRLTPQAKERLAALLPRGQQLADDRICNWADYIKQDQPETAPWHYVNIPYSAAAYDPARDCPTGQCIVAATEQMTRTLADARATVYQRRRALRFLVHFLGDLHQPLHCTSRGDDRGGNRRTVRFPGQPEDTNLHAAWDSDLVRANLGTNDALAYAESLNPLVAAADAAAWSLGSPSAWALESHDLAAETAYKGIPRSGPAVVLDAGYVETNRLVVQRQLMKAGVRLAALLNQALP